MPVQTQRMRNQETEETGTPGRGLARARKLPSVRSPGRVMGSKGREKAPHTGLATALGVGAASQKGLGSSPACPHRGRRGLGPGPDPVGPQLTALPGEEPQQGVPRETTAWPRRVACPLPRAEPAHCGAGAQATGRPQSPTLRPLTSSRPATRMALNTPATPDALLRPRLGPGPEAPASVLQLSEPHELLRGPSGFGAGTTSSKKPPLTAPGPVPHFHGFRGRLVTALGAL